MVTEILANIAIMPKTTRWSSRADALSARIETKISGNAKIQRKFEMCGLDMSRREHAGLFDHRK
jgi:hypothetical protein